jgi:hypothetical protein
MTRRTLWLALIVAASILPGCAVVPLDGPYYGSAYVRGDYGHHRHPYRPHGYGYRRHAPRPWPHRGW